MGLTGSALQEWVDAERVIERDLRVQVRNEQRERIELEERRLQAEERVLQLKLKLQEQATIPASPSSWPPELGLAPAPVTGLPSLARVSSRAALPTGSTPGCRPLGHAPVLVFDLGASPDAIQGASRAVLEPGPRPALFRHPGYVTVLTCCRGRAKVRRKPDCVDFFGPAAALQDRRPRL
ncbi:hypothetical protein HPB52_003084 [Rhipicephalus sanguineus]|uniref:Uncharacterized protein n=1 Tax=Rhipicephalus sanguineus TaxID=34632 RepID=A0A9D4SVF9_RHISA|nr:hypothetical protein HPB52_003084 [Rhipicephalus sanguineus]